MKITVQKHLVLFLLIFISACSITTRNPNNNPVRIVFYNELPGLSRIDLSDCKYLGILISSEGSWYDFIYISNSNLITGSINNMHNLASKMGANLVYIDANMNFKTSVTFVGQAYVCDNFNASTINSIVGDQN